MCDVLSYRSDHLVRPFLGKKNEKIYQKQHEEIGIRIYSKSLAYRRDSCSNGFDLIPKQKKIREVLVFGFCWLKQHSNYIAYRVFLACEGTQNQNKKQGNKQAQHFELTLLSVLLLFSVGNGEFHNDGKDVSFIFLT